MELEPQIFFQNVTECLKQGEKGCTESLKLLNSLNRNLIEEQLDSALLDLYMPHFFHTSTSLLNFINSAAQIKDFKKPCGKAVEILYTVLNNFYHRLSQQEVLSLYSVATKIVKTQITDSFTKAKVYDLVLRSLEKSDGCLEANAVPVYKNLYTSLKNSLQRKNSDIVVGKEMELVGFLSKKYSYIVDDYKVLKSIFWRNFEMHISSQKKLSQYVIQGFYIGFGHYLENFPLDLSIRDDKVKMEKLYKNLKVLVILNVIDKVKLGNRAALHFFGTHISVFTEEILKDYKYWHEKLLLWLNFGVEEKKTGSFALRAFYHSIGETLGNSDDIKHKPVVEYFVEYCRNTLVDKAVTNYEKRISIFCIREVSLAAHKHLSSNEVTELFLFLMQVFEKTFIQEFTPENEDFEYLPDYVQTIANFMKFKEFTTSQFFCLQKGVICMIKSFHQLPFLHHTLIIDSIILTLFYLTKTDYFDTFLQSIIFQGVIWSCSHQHLSAAQSFQDISGEKIITVKNYYGLWRGILKLTSNTSYNRYGFYLPDRKFVLEKIINEFVKTLMILVNKLNVSVKVNDENIMLTELEKAYKAEESNDYAIFLNVIDFYKDIFENIEAKMLRNCVTKMIDHLIFKCIKNPLTSGFYKLLSFSLKITRELSLFEDESDKQCIENTRETLSSFLIVLLNKMEEFKDDLLISCLQVILETPIQIIEPLLLYCTTPFINIFEVGRSYLPLAEMGINTLEHWQNSFKPTVLEPFLAQIIPCLDSFLRSRFLKGYNTQTVQKRRKTMQALKKRKITEELEPELVKLQRKILCFIGRQSLQNCHNFIFSDKCSSDFISGQNSHLKLSLPFDDLQLDIFLDAFLPRLIELALFTSDRKTRITSCELLQASVIVFLGKAKPMSTGGLEEMNNMLKMLVMPLLQLSCDIDNVVQQIFEPLFVQMIHWYTSPTQVGGAHTSIIIGALMEGVTHPTNSNLKDFSGKCINEFMKWTLKHENLDPEANIKVLIKHMRFFSNHPDSIKKLGAALIFNNIYKELREEEHLVSVFWLEIMHIFVLSLDSILSFEETITVNQIKRALNNLKRVLIEKPSTFRKVDEKRRVPNDLGKGLLVNVSIWLLDQTASNSRHCRDICMEFFVNIATLSSKNNLHLHEFIVEHINTTVASLYDKKILEFQSISEETYVEFGHLLQYLRNFLCNLDGYHFIIKNRLETVNFDEKVFSEIQKFLEILQYNDLTTILALIRTKTWTFTTLDKDLYISLKTTCIISIIKLYNAILQDEMLTKKAISLWSNEFWLLLGKVIFYPQDLNLNDIIHTEYKDIIVILLNTIPKKLPKSLLQAFQTTLNNVTQNHHFSSITLEKTTSLKQRNFLKGIGLLNNSPISSNTELFSLVETFIQDLFKQESGGVIFINQLQDTTYSYLLLLLKVTLQKREGLERIIEPLHSPYLVQSIYMVKKISFGLYFVSTFADVVVPVMIQHLETFLRISVNKNNLKVTLEIVNYVLDYITKENLYKTSYKDITNYLLLYWPYFVEFFNKTVDNVDLGIEFLSFFVQICNSGSADMQEWLVNCIKLKKGTDHLKVFGILAKITDDNISERQRNNLEEALNTLNETVLSQSSIADVISNSFNKLLAFYPVVKSTVIFRFLVNIYIKIIATVDMYSLLTKFVTNVDNELQTVFIETVYEMIINNFEHRYVITRDIATPIFQNCNLEVFEQFFVNNIESILTVFEVNDLDICRAHFILIEILFSRIPIGSEEIVDCPITAASKKPKLRTELVKYCLDAFKINENQDELTRSYKCHAYNALASIASNSIKKLIIYEKLFIRSSNNNEALWHSIVNTNINYDFPREFESLPTQKKVIVNIRNELRQNRRKTGDISNTLQYIESQRLFNSSLSEDITKFDFTNSMIRTETEVQTKMMENLHVKNEVSLDMTEINKHECMPTICSLIQYIFDTEISELPAEDDEDVELPNWLNGIRNVLLSEKTHRNVKIFLVKIIDNLIHIFNHYAKWFLEPLIQFIVDKCAGNSINYFVTDVLVIISKWAAIIPNLSNTEASLATKLVDHFVRNIEKDRLDVFKYNIELLKLLVESWRDYLTPPVNIISDKLNSESTLEIGIYVSSVFLVNNLEVWSQGGEQEYLNSLLKQLKTSTRSTYRACSETIGALLLILNSDNFVQQVHKKLYEFSDREKYIICLEGIAIKYPEILNGGHIVRVISFLNQMPVAQLIIILKLLNKRVELSLDILDEISDFKIIDWHQLIEDPNLEIQILALEIIKKCVSVFSTYPIFNSIVETLIKNIYHSNATFRASLYDVAVAILKIKKDVDNKCKEILILGLIDTDFDNQTKIIEFWIQHTDLPLSVVQRFSYMLSEMYKTKIESKLLGFYTYFLLSLLINSEKYDSQIFEHPLEDCDFEEYKLQTNWKLQHPSVVPMFAETLDVYSLQSKSGFELDQDVFRLRKDQTTFEFAPTQSYQEQQLSKYISLESSLGVDMTTFKNPNTSGLSIQYKKRFLKDKNKISRNMAHYETHKQIKKSQERIESAVEREKKVTIYRNYRKGDFPDIQIPLCSIVKPLQILALHDNEISKILFLEIFRGLASKIENNMNFLTDISNGINTIFKTSVQYNRYLFSALMDILLTNKDKLSFDPNLIAKVALESGLASVGALLLEEYILIGDEGPTTSKRNFREENKESICWAKLAELYKDLEEWDTVRAIFLQKMDSRDTIQKALIYESKSLYRESQELYKNLIETDQSEDRRDFYYESYFNCFANLGEWEKIPNAIESVVDDKDTWKGLWEDEWCRQKLLPWYITSKVKTQLYLQENNEEFLENLNKCLVDSNYNDYLTSHFSEELCLLWLSQKDVITATQYLKITMKNFLDDWQILNPMFQTQRFQKLLKLQNVIEIADFIDVYINLTDDIDISIKSLINRWRKCNDLPISVLFSESKVLYRKQFVDTMLHKLSTLENLNLKEQMKDLCIAKVRMDVDLINTAAEFGNFYVTRKYLRIYQNKENDKLDLAKGNVLVIKSKMMKSEMDQINLYLEAINIFKKISISPEDVLKSSSKIFDIAIDIYQLISNNTSLLSEFSSKLRSCIEKPITSSTDIEKYGYDLLKTTAENYTIPEEMECDSINNTENVNKFKNISDAYIKLAHFIRNKNDENLQGDFILFILRAMRLNSSEARQLFPCILYINSINELHKNLFLEEVENIPTWMFLGWIPQLLANVDSPRIFALSKLILRIAETYPQAIMYPYRLSKENYNFNNNSIATEAKILTNRLDELLLKDVQINKFLKALSYVSIPANILLYYVKKIKACSDFEIIKKYAEAVQNEVFDQPVGTANINNLQGNMFKKIDKFKNEFQKFFNRGITVLKVKELSIAFENELKQMLNWDNKKKSSLPSLMLKDYCPWLANFSANKLNIELEIPGQYDGQKLPLPQHHVKISGFYPEIKIMESLRKPMKIIILGMDTKEYPFLLKFGEDLRQDQRIEQLFCLMNEFLRTDNQSSRNGLDILTYQVIPLTSNLGLIQWVNDTQPLTNFISKTFKNEKQHVQFLNLGSSHHKNLKVFDNNYFKGFGQAAQKIKRDKIIVNFMTLIKMVQPDILKTSFKILSTSTENYIALRNNFIKTYSVLCASHWILGIGDRHPGNSLICLKNGKVLGIDFGHAFGTATQILPVPELVPFRLTPHIINFMEPLKEKGTFREYLIHCLRCLRINSSPLLATMNVFIQEPSLDWLEHTDLSDDSQSDKWYPLIKIEQAKRKLMGANSVDIMTEELTDGCRDKNYTAAYIKHIKGDEGECYRAGFLGRGDLSVEEQVDCLIDHATDYNLLGRMYGGWTPWL